MATAKTLPPVAVALKHYVHAYAHPTALQNKDTIALITAIGEQAQAYKKLLPEFKNRMQTLMFVQDIANCDNVDEIFRISLNEVEGSNEKAKKLIHISAKFAEDLGNILQNHFSVIMFHPNVIAALMALSADFLTAGAEDIYQSMKSDPHDAAFEFAYGLVGKYAGLAMQQLALGGELDHYTEAESTQVFIDMAKELGVTPEQAKNVYQQVMEAFQEILQSAMTLTGAQKQS